MDQITHDVRTAQWAEIVRKCHERPENQSAKNWLNENGINEKQYYYWQRRLRNMAAGTTNKSLPTTRSSGEVTFIEMPSPNELPGERMEEVTINSGLAALILSALRPQNRKSVPFSNGLRSYLVPTT